MFGRGSKKTPSGVNMQHSSFGMKEGGYNPNFGAMTMFEEAKRDANRPRGERQKGRPGRGWEDSDDEEDAPRLNPGGGSGFGQGGNRPAAGGSARNPYVDPRYKASAAPSTTSTTSASSGSGFAGSQASSSTRSSRYSAEHDTAGEYETKLVNDICQPGGARIKPPDAVLNEFCTKCKSLKTVVISNLLLDQTKKTNAIIQQKALYVIEALMKQLGGYKQYFKDNEGKFSEIPNLTNGGVKSQLNIVQAFIHGRDPRAHQFEKVETVHESYGTKATKAQEPTPSGDLLGGNEDTPSTENQNSTAGGLLDNDLLGGDSGSSPNDVLSLGTENTASSNGGNAFGFISSDNTATAAASSTGNTSASTGGNAFGFISSGNTETANATSTPSTGSAFGFVNSSTAAPTTESKGNAFNFMGGNAAVSTTETTTAAKGNAFDFMGGGGSGSTQATNETANTVQAEGNSSAEQKMTTTLFENLSVSEKKNQGDPFAEIANVTPESSNTTTNTMAPSSTTAMGAPSGGNAFGFISGSNSAANGAQGSQQANAFDFMKQNGSTGNTATTGGPSASDLQNQIKMSYGGNAGNASAGGMTMGMGAGMPMGGNQMGMNMMDPNQLQMQIQYLQRMQQMQQMQMNQMGGAANPGMGMGAGMGMGQSGMAYNLAPMSGNTDYQPALGKQKSEEKKPDEFDFVNSMMQKK